MTKENTIWIHAFGICQNSKKEREEGRKKGRKGWREKRREKRRRESVKKVGWGSGGSLILYAKE